MATTTVNNYIENVRTYFSNFEFSSLGIPGLVLLILAMLVIPYLHYYWIFYLHLIYWWGCGDNDCNRN